MEHKHAHTSQTLPEHVSVPPGACGAKERPTLAIGGGGGGTRGRDIFTDDDRAIDSPTNHEQRSRRDASPKDKINYMYISHSDRIALKSILTLV